MNGHCVTSCSCEHLFVFACICRFRWNCAFGYAFVSLCVCHVCVKTKRKARALKAKSNNDSRIVVGIIHLQMNSKDLIPKIKNHQKIYDLSLLEGSTWTLFLWLYRSLSISHIDPNHAPKNTCNLIYLVPITTPSLLLLIRFWCGIIRSLSISRWSFLYPYKLKYRKALGMLVKNEVRRTNRYSWWKD